MARSKYSSQASVATILQEHNAKKMLKQALAGNPYMRRAKEGFRERLQGSRSLGAKAAKHCPEVSFCIRRSGFFLSEDVTAALSSVGAQTLRARRPVTLRSAIFVGGARSQHLSTRHGSLASKPTQSTGAPKNAEEHTLMWNTD